MKRVGLVAKPDAAGAPDALARLIDALGARGLGILLEKETAGVVPSAALPSVPTVAESGLKGYEATNWYGYVAPAATPRPIVERLHKATVAVLEMPDVRQTLLDQGIEAQSSSPEQFSDYIRSETKKWEPVIRRANIKP